MSYSSSSVKNYLLRMLSPVISGLCTHVDAETFGHLFSATIGFVPEQDKAALRNLAQMCQDGHPMVTGWLRALNGLSPRSRRALIQNLIVNESVVGASLREEMGRKYGTHIPYLVLISPTYKCNLRCVGCYSARYGDTYAFTKEEMYDVIGQFYDLGVRFFTFTGGEPFLVPYIMDLFADHPDCYFMVYTNGTLINQNDRARRLGELGNVAVTISVEGWEDMTDWRRGPGVFKKVVAAYRSLRENGVLCGASVTATAKNHDQLMQDAFWDFLSQCGVEYVWIFQYMPIGRGATFDLVPSPEQRYQRFYKIEAMRQAGKFAFMADFWNHGYLVNGCMAGGSKYLHINAKGGVEPCVFQQYAVDNVHEKRVIDILKSPFFESFKRDIPFSDNLMKPCPIIDNPDQFRDRIVKYHAQPQHDGSNSYFQFAPQLDAMARAWDGYAAKVWSDEKLADDYPAEHGLYDARRYQGD